MIKAMSMYRVVSEGMYVIDPEGARLPGLRQVPVWHGDHMPSVAELREISANQADVETQAKIDRLASGDEATKMLAELLGEEFYIPSHWPLLVQRRRLGKILGHKTLGTVRTADLLVENDDKFELAPYWRHAKTRPSDRSPEARRAHRMLTALSLGSTAVIAAELVYLVKH